MVWASKDAKLRSFPEAYLSGTSPTFLYKLLPDAARNALYRRGRRYRGFGQAVPVDRRAMVGCGKLQRQLLIVVQ